MTDAAGRALQILRDAPRSELKSLVLHDHIETHTKHTFTELLDNSTNIWHSLPDSVIGTLIYFILVEHNVSDLRTWETLYYVFTVGLPVYFTFFLQADIVYELYQFLGTTNSWESYCESSPVLLFTISCVFCIFIFPSYRTIINETYIVLKAERVAFTHQEDEITLHRVLAPMSKRILIWCLVVLPESLILTFLSFTGLAYVMTSKGIADIIINSVAVVFVMDIDNMARNALQTDSVSSHVDQMTFDTTQIKPNESKNDGSELGQAISDETYATFSRIREVCIICAIATIVTWIFVGSCGDDVPLIGRLIDTDDDHQ